MKLVNNFKSLILKAVVAFSVISMLAGCSNIEKRSSIVPKKKLEPLTQNLNFATIWSVNATSGAGKSKPELALVNTNQEIYVAGAKGDIVAINKADGEIVSTIEISGKISSGPAVVGSSVVVATDEGRLIAVNKNGQQLWKIKVGSELLSVPTIYENSILTHTLDGRVLAFNSNNGAEVWRFTYAQPKIVLRKSSSPVYTNNSFIVGLANGKLVSLTESAGQPEWVLDLSNYSQGTTDLKIMSDISSAPVINGDIAYVVNYQGKVVAVSVATGQILWDREASSFSGLNVDNSKVFVSADNGHLIAYDKDSGSIVWQQEELEGRALSKPAFYKNLVVVADDDGSIHFLSKKSGKLIGRFYTDSKGIKSNLVIEKDVIYALGNNGKVFAFKAFMS